MEHQLGTPPPCRVGRAISPDALERRSFLRRSQNPAPSLVLSAHPRGSSPQHPTDPFFWVFDAPCRGRFARQRHGHRATRVRFFMDELGHASGCQSVGEQPWTSQPRPRPRAECQSSTGGKSAPRTTPPTSPRQLWVSVPVHGPAAWHQAAMTMLPARSPGRPRRPARVTSL